MKCWGAWDTYKAKDITSSTHRLVIQERCRKRKRGASSDKMPPVKACQWTWQSSANSSETSKMRDFCRRKNFPTRTPDNVASVLLYYERYHTRMIGLLWEVVFDLGFSGLKIHIFSLFFFFFFFFSFSPSFLTPSPLLFLSCHFFVQRSILLFIDKSPKFFVCCFIEISKCISPTHSSTVRTSQ